MRLTIKRWSKVKPKRAQHFGIGFGPSFRGFWDRIRSDWQSKGDQKWSKKEINIDFYENRNEKEGSMKSDIKRPVDQYDYNLGTNTKMVLDFTNDDSD